MPHYSYLAAPLSCLTCGHVISDVAYFQWGYSRGYGLRETDLYHPGDQIRWQVTKDGSVLPWVYFWERRNGEILDLGSNHGDPAIKSLLVRDPVQFFHEPELPSKICSVCHEGIGGAVVEIHNNVITMSFKERESILQGRSTNRPMFTLLIRME